MEEFYGIVPCTVMSMMSQSLLPSACEVDITGLLSMYILQLAGGGPSAILDWNNNFGTNPDKCMVFHCSNLPKSFFKSAKMDYQEIIAASVGKNNAYGAVVGKIAPNKATFCRLTTDDPAGTITGYAGQGEFTRDNINSFGGYGVLKVKNLQSLLQYICRAGFEHHVAANICCKADAITEALENYMGWEIYRHR
jgi:L-fucose isomerase-like protein